MTAPRMRIAVTALAAAAAILAPSSASAGVVVGASGPSAASFPVGKKLGDTERIVLRPGDTLTVLDGKGTRVLRGAGTYTLAQQAAGPGKQNAFAVLTERRSAGRMRTGAVRAEPEEAAKQPANLWYVDVGHPGTVCLAGTDRVRLWRGAIDGDATYSLRGEAGSHTVTFADGEALAPWDTKVLPIADGAVFRIKGPDGSAEHELSFAVLDSVADDPEALAEQLIGHGCAQQLELLSTTMMIEEG